MPESIEKRIKELRDEVTKHTYQYYVLSKPTIGDYEFDMLFKELETLEKENPQFITPDSPSQRVGSDLTESFEKVLHRFPMLSLDNAYSLEELSAFEKRNSKLLDADYEYVAELKIDGLAISLIYEKGILRKAVTRGDGQIGDDVTANVKTIRSIPLKVFSDDIPDIFEVRGEIFLSYEAFQKNNEERTSNGEEPFANPRNSASGTLKCETLK